ncbi:MAG: flagellar hook-associated protein FlgL [Anaerolineae bacterium]
MRITQNMLSDAALRGMQANLTKVSDLQRDAVTTKRLHRPSDDPFALEQSLAFRAKIATSESVRDNIEMSRNWLNVTDAALSDTAGLLTRARMLNIQGANDTLGPEERQSVSIEVNQMLEEMLAVANTRHGDDYIFSGFETDQPPFVAVRDATGQITSVTVNPPDGIAGQIIREIEPGVDMVVNVPGDAVFPDTFTALMDLRDALVAVPYSQQTVSDLIADLKGRQDTSLDVQAAVGTKLRRIDSAVARMENTELGMRELLSKAEDADMPEVISDLQQQQYIYQTALAVNGQILRTSLLDFIR